MVPNIIHFIFGLEKKFGDKPFGLSHYLAIKSAYIVNNPDKIYFFYRYEPTGEWWERAKLFVEPIQISVPRKVLGNKLYHYAHKADIIRLMVLSNYGGVYLDIDTICIKPFNNLLKFDFVLGEQNIYKKEYGLCNAVILSKKDSSFLKLWYSSYKYFRSKGHDQYWDEHSVIVPLILSKKYPQYIHIEKETSFFYPSYTEIETLFEKCKLFPEAYIFHLWESFSYEKYLSQLTTSSIREQNTTYNIIARKYLD